MSIMSRSLCAALAVAAGCWFSLAEARADNLDQTLLEQAPALIRYLREKNYHHVGVLKFRVKKGDQPATFDAGPLNAGIAGRLENALVLANDKESPVGIIHDANRVGAAKRLPAYTGAAGRQRLFQQAYTPAWGARTVSADAFL